MFMPIKFQKYTAQSEDFFKILPEDWVENLGPIWTKERGKAAVFVLLDADRIVAGGIIFSGLTEDMDGFKEEAIAFVASGYLYIGYLWVIESRRGENLGSLWLTALKAYFPETSFWLTIEEDKLKHFYLKNGFRILKENTHREWLLLMEAPEDVKV